VDFGPQKPILMLSLFILFYGFGLGAAVFFIVVDMISRSPASLANLLEVAFIIGSYLLVALFLLFYVIFSPYRFVFAEDGLQVLTWRGRQFFSWEEVRKASLSSYQGNIDLVLHCGGLRYLTIPLTSFRRSASLFEAVKQKLPVRIAASEQQLRRLQDDGIGM
jgi:hypothetical protein